MPRLNSCIYWVRTKDGPGVHGPPLWTGSMDPLQVQNTGHRSRVIVLQIQKVSQRLIKANLRPKNFCLGLIKNFCLGLIRPKVSFYNVWDTFCIVKAMTCDLCFVPAAGQWTWSREGAHGPQGSIFCPYLHLFQSQGNFWNHLRFEKFWDN